MPSVNQQVAATAATRPRGTAGRRTRRALLHPQLRIHVVPKAVHVAGGGHNQRVALASSHANHRHAAHLTGCHAHRRVPTALVVAQPQLAVRARAGSK